METLWFSILLLVVCIYFVLDGYDFGVGIIHLFFAETEEDKTVIAKSAGLFWDFNEVWLVVTGGLLFMAFPVYYASVFSGFYLPLMILLWLMIFRATGIELRNQFSNEVWKSFWDKSFGISSLLLAVFCGGALGNIVRGVNLGQVENGTSTLPEQYFFLPLWNEQFSPLSANVGVLDWFTVLIGILAVLILSVHGANWIILKTNSPLIPKLKNYIFRINFVILLFLMISLYAWSSISGDMYSVLKQNGLVYVFAAIFLVGFLGLFRIKTIKNPVIGFLCST
ncbi:MAG: cytochrome d ubiquinol oxidase subunit II, partial [Cruoricaptor ignavus]|nr:cytochrome d ubiquinol oxidase subunit II [Cruoricaptor ignavus]